MLIWIHPYTNGWTLSKLLIENKLPTIFMSMSMTKWIHAILSYMQNLTTDMIKTTHTHTRTRIPVFILATILINTIVKFREKKILIDLWLLSLEYQYIINYIVRVFLFWIIKKFFFYSQKKSILIDLSNQN